MSKIILLLAITIFLYCNQHSKGSSEMPLLKPTNGITNTLKIHTLDSIHPVWPEFFGKFKEGEQVRFRDLDSVDYEGPDIDWDLSALVAIPNATEGFKVYAYPDEKMVSGYDSRHSFYDTMNYYPVHVVNESGDDRFFTLKDNYVYALHEALYIDGNWYPIEMRGPEECGNGRWCFKTKPQEFAVFLMNRYHGNFKTQLRVRLRIGNSVFFSNSFEGHININQFFSRTFVRDDEQFITMFLFHGATPLQIALGKLNCGPYY